MFRRKFFFFFQSSGQGSSTSKDYLIVIAFILILSICAVLVYIKVSRINLEKMMEKMVVTENPHYASHLGHEEMRKGEVNLTCFTKIYDSTCPYFLT